MHKKKKFQLRKVTGTSSSGLTLKLATKREYIAQWCYCSLFKFMEDYKQSYEIHQRRCEKKGTELCKVISTETFE